MSQTNHKKRPRQPIIGKAAEVREGKPMKISTDDSRRERARLQIIGACLMDSALSWHIPTIIHFSEYGAFLIMMIQRGMGLESIVAHLEGVGITDAFLMLSRALQAIPDGGEIAPIFWSAVQVLAEGVPAP